MTFDEKLNAIEKSKKDTCLNCQKNPVGQQDPLDTSDKKRLKTNTKVAKKKSKATSKKAKVASKKTKAANMNNSIK